MTPLASQSLPILNVPVSTKLDVPAFPIIDGTGTRIPNIGGQEVSTFLSVAPLSHHPLAKYSIKSAGLTLHMGILFSIPQKEQSQFAHPLEGTQSFCSVSERKKVTLLNRE